MSTAHPIAPNELDCVVRVDDIQQRICITTLDNTAIAYQLWEAVNTTISKSFEASAKNSARYGRNRAKTSTFSAL